MYPTKGKDWSVEDVPRSIFDMTLDEYFVFCGGNILSATENEEEYPFDKYYLEKKKKLTHAILDDDLDDYMLWANEEILTDNDPMPYNASSLGPIWEKRPTPALKTLESLRIEYGIPIIEDSVPEEYPFDENYLKKKSFYTHQILDYELECYFYNYKAAGCLFYSFDKGKTYLLLQKKPTDPYYYDFGGKKEPGELFYECAMREIFEESNGRLNINGAKFRGIHRQYAFYVKGMKKISPKELGDSNNDGPRTVGWYDYDLIKSHLSPRIPKIIVDELRPKAM